MIFIVMRHENMLGIIEAPIGTGSEKLAKFWLMTQGYPNPSERDRDGLYFTGYHPLKYEEVK